MIRRRKRKYPSKYILPDYPAAAVRAELIFFFVVAVIATFAVTLWISGR